MSITIDQEFHALCPPLQREEQEQLTASLLAEGCREPLCVWDDENRMLLLDGHNRHAICSEHDIAYETRAIHLDSREDAIHWIIATQLGRRNLTPEQKSYLRGKRYNLEKRQDGGHGDQKSEDKNYPPIREKLAKEYQVSNTTIKNDGQFASAVDTLEAQVRQDIRETVLRRQDREQGKITKQQAMHTGKLVQERQVSPQPFMRRDGWKPYQVLEAIEILGSEKIPQEEHSAINSLLDQPYTPASDGLTILRYLQDSPLERRQLIYRLSQSTDPRERSDAITMASGKPPEPDKQQLIAQHLIRAVDDIRQRQRRNWIREFPDEPWIDELQNIDTLLAAIQDRWKDIAARVKTSRLAKVESYDRTIADD